MNHVGPDPSQPRDAAALGLNLRKLLVDRTGRTLLVRIGGTAAGITLTWMLARVLGAEGVGAYAYAISWVVILAIPCQMGLSNLLVRETARYVLDRNWSLLRGLLTFSNRVVLLASVVVATAVFAISLALGGHENPQMTQAFRVGLLLLPLVCLLAVKRSTMEGLRHVVAANATDLLTYPLLTLAGSVIAWVVLRQRFDAVTAMTVTLGAAAITLIVAWTMTRARLPDAMKAAPVEYQLRPWLAAATPMMLMGTVYIIGSRTDIVMLGLLRNAEDAGVYSPVARGAALVTLALASVNAAIAPEISRLHATNDHQSLQRMLTHTARVALGLTVPLVAVFIIFGRWFLWLFGPEFMRGDVALSILCVGQLLNVAAGSVAMILMMTGYEKDALRGLLLSTAANIVLNLLLIPPWGIMGAAVATATSLLIWNVVMIAMVRRRLQLDSTALGWLVKGSRP